MFRKKIYIIFLLLVFLFGCSNTPSENVLMKSDFNNTQKKLLENLGISQNIVYFKYQGKEKQVKLSVDMYKNGAHTNILSTNTKLSSSSNDIICLLEKFKDYQRVTINGGTSTFIDKSRVNFEEYQNDTLLINPYKINLDASSESILAVKVLSNNSVILNKDNIFLKFDKQKDVLFKDACVYLLKIHTNKK